jgi:hypothetical protein
LWRKRCCILSDPYKKWREEQILFLDDAFDCDDTNNILVAAGYKVERFTNHFPDSHRVREQSVQDDRVLKFCNQYGYLLITTDANIIKTHRIEIERSEDIGILATAHNSADSIIPWAESLVKLKPTLDRNSFKKKLRPWFGKFDRNGNITVRVKTVTPKALLIAG